MDTVKLLRALLRELVSEVEVNEGLRNKLDVLIKRQCGSEIHQTPKKSNRRKPGLFDPVSVYRENPDSLQPRLENLEIEELKDIVAEQGLDRAKLAMKWKSKERLIELIVTSVKMRSQKGDAFRT